MAESGAAPVPAMAVNEGRASDEPLGEAIGGEASQKTIDVNSIIARLAQQFPLAFAVPGRLRKPLKIGIHADILAATGGAITADELSAALQVYAVHIKYLKACCRVGAPRIGLDGLPAGEVTFAQVAHASRALARAESKRQAPTPPPKAPSPRQGASLAALRAAGKARRRTP
jgi:ProP effector